MSSTDPLRARIVWALTNAVEAPNPSPKDVADAVVRVLADPTLLSAILAATGHEVREGWMDTYENGRWTVDDFSGVALTDTCNVPVFVVVCPRGVVAE